MTSFALTLWVYENTGSALQTALLSICSYSPYVLMSIFAGALCDRWDKKAVLLVCDSLAALCTLTVLILYAGGLLHPGHLYLLNLFSGLMNTVQQPSGDTAITLITPKRHYQRTSGLRSFSGSLITILHPVLAALLFAAAGMTGVILVDLATFAAAFLSLLFFVKIPKRSQDSEFEEGGQTSIRESVRIGLRFLRGHRLILTLILFMAGVNFVASAFDAVLPPYVLSSTGGNESVLGTVMACAGIATLVGSLLVAFLPAPKNRVRVIWLTMLISLGTENFLLAFTHCPVWWCLAQWIGWILVPVMNANLDVILRSGIPAGIQGRVYACRNSLQFFTIPLGTFAGGFLVDRICNPILAASGENGFAARLFGSGAGSGAALSLFLLGIVGVGVCLAFAPILNRYRFSDSPEQIP